MKNKMIIGLLVSVLTVPFIPAMSMAGPGRHYHGHHGHYRHHGSGSGWVWGLGGLMLGSVLVAAAMQPPPPRQVVYAAPPPPPVAYYPYQAPVSTGTCRWERYVLDGYGRTMFDRYGQPIKEYTTGPCGYPPPR